MKHTPFFTTPTAAARLVFRLHILALLVCWSVAARSATFFLPADGSNIVGQLQVVTADSRNTLLDIARHYDLGFEEITVANPGVSMSQDFFGARFANGLPRDQVDAHFARYIVPTAGKVYWDGVTSGGAGPIVWDSTMRAPMLLIGGGKDLTAPSSMTEAIFKKQKHAASPTELKIYQDRSHYICAEPGWEEVADFALAWSEKNQRAGDAAKAT